MKLTKVSNEETLGSIDKYRFICYCSRSAKTFTLERKARYDQQADCYFQSCLHSRWHSVFRMCRAQAPRPSQFEPGFGQFVYLFGEHRMDQGPKGILG